MNYLFNRLREGSTYGGLGLIAYGLGELFKINEAPAIAQAIGQAGEVAVSGADPVTAALALVAGVAAAFVKDKD